MHMTETCGKGAAVVTGFREAQARGFTHAVQVDADGQHTLSDVRRFIEEARAHPGSVICGRPIFDASIPKARFYGRYLTHSLVWLETLSFEIVDSMCGFRVYPLAPTMALLDRSGVGARMDFDTDILVRLVWRRTPTRWLATHVSYPLDGVSHYRMFFDNARMTSLHVRLLLGMLPRAPVLLWRKLQPTKEGRLERRDVIVIGAGPAGSIAAALLKRRGWDVLVLEGQRFPRFSIGESLLAHCLDFVAEAGMMEAVEAAGFQYKNGAAFIRDDDYGEFDFGDGFTPGRASTYQVQRAPFDKLLADEAERQGVEIRYETRVTAVEPGETPSITQSTPGIASIGRQVASCSMQAALRGRCRGCSSSRRRRPSPCATRCSRTSQTTRPRTPSTATRSRWSSIRGIATCGIGSFPSSTVVARSAALRARNSSMRILRRSMSVSKRSSAKSLF